jgi:hypothetical protein
MNITITIPDEIAPRVLDALADRHGYTGKDEAGQAQTKGQFAKVQITDWLKSEVLMHEHEQTRRDVRAALPPLEF